MNEIKIFNNPQFGEIRTATTEAGEPLFCLADLCKALDLTNTTVVAQRIDEEYKAKLDLGLKNKQDATFVTEPGMYSVILRSDSPLAKPMQKWVTSEVLPTIRKHGAYMSSAVIEKTLSDPDFIIRLATDLKEERRKNELAQKQLEHQAPIIKYATEVLQSKSGHTPTQIASELNMSAKTLNLMLLAAKFIRETGKGEYSITALNQGRSYSIPVTAKFNHKDGTPGTKISLHYTEEGRKRIHEIFERAKTAGVVYEKRNRFFYNSSWNLKQGEAA